MPLQNSHQTQGANFLALPSVLDLGQSPCGAHLTLSLLPLQNILRTVQKTAFFVLKGRSNKKQPAPTSVGANNFWSRSVNYCKEFPNRSSFNPILVLPSCHKDKFFRDQVDRCRGPGIVKERSYSGSQSFRPGLLQPFISCSQERGHLPARDRFEFIKPFCSPLSFSDGGAPLFKDRSQERGPHDKYRSKRRIFFRSPLAPKGSSNPAHTNPEGPPVRLQLSSISQSPVSSRANLVAKQFTQGQRQPCFSPTTESHNSLRCFNARLACHVSGQVHKGKWFSQESIQHINLLVLKAAFLALKTFLKDQSHKVVLLKLDNSTAVAYLNNKGGTHSVPLMSLTLEMWTWCLQRNILISAQHVPGKENTVADSESLTLLDSTDWQLDPTVITPFLTNWNTDLFASRLTAQLRQYLKAYESAWSRWSRWCAKGKINPISAPLSKILDFLANAFSDGLVYRSINVLSSAISSTHSRIDNFLVGQHPHVTKLIKGVLNSCPPKPRYSYTWDVKKATAIRRSCFLPYFSKKAWQP